MLKYGWMQCLRIQRHGVDDGAIVHHVPLAIEGKRRPLVDGPAGVAFNFVQQQRCFLRRVRIARVPDVVGVIVVERAAIVIGSRLGEYFDAAVTEPVILGRERVLVDANFADRILGREFAAAESVDENRATAGAGRWTGERLKVSRQIVRIVGESLQIVAAQDERSRVVGGIDGDGWAGGLLDNDMLRCSDDVQLEIQRLHA